MRQLLITIAGLVRIRVTLAVTFSTFVGYILYNPEYNAILIFTITGVLLLAAGSSALNQYQERDIDAKMDRTSMRSIPSGKIKPGTALIISMIFLLSGSGFLYAGAGIQGTTPGWLSVLWYNGVYTMLKQRTPYALIAGSLTGAIPPAIGWIAAGGHIADPQIIMLSFFAYMWQVPHFCLLLIRYGKEYEDAGFLPLSKFVSLVQLKRITFTWLMATALTTLAMPLFKLVTSAPACLTLFLLSFFLITVFYKQLIINKKIMNHKLAFAAINSYLLLVLLLLIAEKII